jgi:hypothetical protein
MENLIYAVSDTDRIFVYAWYEKTNPNQTKFGERYVFAGQDPYEECSSRIRESTGVRKDLYDDGTIVIPMIWDVTEYAIKYDKFHPKSKVDDLIRKEIGYVKKNEVHNLNYNLLVDKVNDILRKENQPRPVVSLSTAQYEDAVKVLISVENGKKRILAELAARYGKTIWSSVIAIESGIPIVVVTSYVLTSFTSFKNDIRKFQQFQNIEIVHTSDENYQIQIKEFINENKQVMVFLSLCDGSKREERINFLNNINLQRLVFVDEADYGAHQKKQFIALKKLVKNDDVLVLMTGTNSDRASSDWDIDLLVSTTYFELLVNKKETKLGDETMGGLKYFKKDISRDKVYASVEGYQLDLRTVVEKCKQMNVNHDELPSWAKLSANPKKGKGWFITLLEGMFKGKHNLDGINIEGLVDSTNGKLSDRRVAMMFLPDNTRVENLITIGHIAQETLYGWRVLVLNGQTVKDNSECEMKVKETIESTEGNVLIIASKMAQRSFSEELIDELYLAYDRGQDGATIQKMSRALTSNSLNKIARIFSLSFDPNRDDKLDVLVFQAAINQVEKKGKSDIREELKRVYRSIDIYSCNDSGAIKLDVDDYVKHAIEKKGISRVMGKKTDLSKLTNEQIKSISQGNIDFLRNENKESVETGKTKDTLPKNTDTDKLQKPTDSEIEKAREVIITIYEHSDIIMLGTKHYGAKNVKEALLVIENEKMTQDIEQEFGVKYEIIKYLFLNGVIKQEWINLLHG